MAETFRAPKLVQEEVKQNQGELADRVAINSSLSIKDVMVMSRTWQGVKGLEWSNRITDDLLKRSSLLSSARALSLIAEENDMADMNQVPDLNEELTELLADVFSFYLRAHGAHWNVVGTDFAEYHKLFQKIYEDVYESVDPIAENLRKLGSKAPFQLTQFLALRTLEDAGVVSQDPRALAMDLLAANDILLDEISDAFDCATAYGQQGVANFLAGRMDQHQLWKWQLSASLGLEVAIANPDPVDAQGIDQDDVAEQTEGLTMPMVMTYSAERSESNEDDPLEDRVSAARIGEGSFVSWSTSNGRARGKVEKVISKGQAISSDGYVIEATADAPAFSIRIYKEQGNGWIPTDTVVVHRNNYLTITSALPAPRSEDVSMIEERKTMIRNAEQITMNAEVRAVKTDDGTLRIGGYAATFGNEATGLNFREVIAQGAFTRTLAAENPIFLLVNHDMEQLPLASTKSGTLRLSEDSVGLRMEADLDPNNPRAVELASALSRGDVDKMSFAFTVAPGGDTRAEGLRTLTDLDLYEVSVVNLPAYDATAVGMRSAEEDLTLRKRKIKAKFNHSRLKK